MVFYALAALALMIPSEMDEMCALGTLSDDSARPIAGRWEEGWFPPHATCVLKDGTVVRVIELWWHAVMIAAVAGSGVCVVLARRAELRLKVTGERVTEDLPG
ncbi:hypothetical protein [Streptomyces sp. NBC_01304]|uniref:hypothetical protein n=1 Tax=Streptomyces sp. NBC_01304 TaxID=2903818 RepID=UPI002E0EDC03|nr:hypothetical protein OG430_44130 [Streptomyces sp. NBC_01304]